MGKCTPTMQKLQLILVLRRVFQLVLPAARSTGNSHLSEGIDKEVLYFVSVRGRHLAVVFDAIAHIPSNGIEFVLFAERLQLLEVTIVQVDEHVLQTAAHRRIQHTVEYCIVCFEYTVVFFGR